MTKPKPDTKINELLISLNTKLKGTGYKVERSVSMPTTRFNLTYKGDPVESLLTKNEIITAVTIRVKNYTA